MGFSSDIPAFDLIMDFNKGVAHQFFNLTGDCKAFHIPKVNLTHYLHEMFTKHTEHAGHRGEHLDIYEVKHPEEDGSRTWVYGMWIHNEHHEHPFFIPARFQSHHPEQKVE